MLIKFLKDKLFLKEHKKEKSIYEIKSINKEIRHEYVNVKYHSLYINPTSVFNNDRIPAQNYFLRSQLL